MTPKIRIVAIAQLVLDKKNANKGTKRGRELLGKSLEKYGAGRSVVVDRPNRVIAGNKTVEAARAAGMKFIAASKKKVFLGASSTGHTHRAACVQRSREMARSSWMILAGRPPTSS